MAEQITNYKCPACSGPLHFSGNSGQMECDYCGSTYTIEEIEAKYEVANERAAEAKLAADAKVAAVQAEAADEWAISDEQLDGTGMKSYTCPSCGAELVCEETTAASSCPYCGNPTVVPGQFTGMLKPDFVIPFKYEKKQALESLRKHYGNRFLLPKTFKDTNHLEEIKGVYVPFWLYDGQSAGACTYEATKSSVHREGDEQVTVTQYYRVERQGQLSFEKIPADASSRMDDSLMDSIEPYHYSELKPFVKAYLTGYLADKYDETAEENADRALGRAKQSTKDALRNDVRGYSSITPLSEQVRVEQGKVSYALMPVWLLHTKWDNKDFMFAMNGQTGKMVGDLPVDGGKLTITTILTALISFALCYFLAGCSLGMSIGIAVAISAILAFILYSSMKSIAKASTADSYIKDGSVTITHRRDLYVRTQETRVRIEPPKKN